MSFNIAIDGPAGAGKSTIAKRVAKKMNLIYVDTGAMYRAMGIHLLRCKIGMDDEKAISRECMYADITIKYENGEQVVYLNGENVNPLLRTEEAGNMASACSVYKDVRTKLVQLQQKLASEADVIMDGRDIGTVVLPNANLKVYLTASVEVRAKRRYEELLAKKQDCDFELSNPKALLLRSAFYTRKKTLSIFLKLFCAIPAKTILFTQLTMEK